LRGILPIGGVWTPILNGTYRIFDLVASSFMMKSASPVPYPFRPFLLELVFIMNGLQSKTVERVSCYRVTTGFALELKDDSTLSSVHVTGHSLGGGLAIITGAQAAIPAVALSGPNAKISGKSFDPPVTEEQLNRYTFNIRPDRDIVSRFDDVANNFQNIRCEADANDFMGCHGFVRSLCELMYTRGTGTRPAICECHTLYGYPKPFTDGDENFDELCGDSIET
jgi:lipase ATG15